jgi:hypothetical protein
VANDASMVNIKVDDGSWLFHRRKDNPFMENLMNEAVVDILSNPENYDKKKKKITLMTRCPR